MFNLPRRVFERRNVDVGGKLSRGTLAFGKYVGPKNDDLVATSLNKCDGEAYASHDSKMSILVVEASKRKHRYALVRTLLLIGP